MTDDTTNDIYELTDDQELATDLGAAYNYSATSALTGGNSFNYTSVLPNVTAILSSSLGTGGAGATYTTGAGLGTVFPAGSITAGAGTSTWTYNNTITATASPYISTNGYVYPNTITSGHTLQVNGDARIDGSLTVKGVNLSERLDQIEQRLGILRPNNDLEGKWEQLKALGDQYRQLEKEILEKESMWDILKK